MVSCRGGRCPTGLGRGPSSPPPSPTHRGLELAPHFQATTHILTLSFSSVERVTALTPSTFPNCLGDKVTGLGRHQAPHGREMKGSSQCCYSIFSVVHSGLCLSAEELVIRPLQVEISNQRRVGKKCISSLLSASKKAPIRILGIPTAFTKHCDELGANES